VLDPAGLPTALTQKVPGLVKVCTLKFVQAVVIVPPVAAI
jgi:hypothetical protein